MNELWPENRTVDQARIDGVRAAAASLGEDLSRTSDEEIAAGLARKPPMSLDELVSAKWGQIDISQRELAEAAIYWYDQARVFYIMLTAARGA